MKLIKKHFLLVTICAIICVALFLGSTMNKDENADDALDAKQASAVTEEETQEDKVLGQAEFVNATTEYFDSARLNRQETRAEATGILQGIIDSETATEEERAQAQEKILRLSNAADAEGRIENLVKAKGYTECIAIIGEESVSVIVQTDGLESSDVATIKDIATTESAMAPGEIKIIESK